VYTSLQHSAPYPVTVNVNRTEPMYLVVSALDPVTFTVNAGPGAQLLGIHIIGGNGVTVLGPSGVPVTTSSTFAYGYTYYPTMPLVTVAQQDLGVPLTSYMGCYEVGAFDIQ
jgi:hypothetical protein